MKRVSFNSQHHLEFAPLAALGLSFLLTLSGCPGGAELEHPEKYGLTGGNGAMTGSGGTTPGSGGTTAGSSGSGAMLTVDCGATTYQDVLSNTCATPGCHKPIAGVPGASGLNLMPDDGLVGRLKNVKAQHGDIACPPDFNTCVPATCDPNVLLIDSKTPANSWLLAKLKGNQNGCGDPMPPPSGPSADVESCLENFVNAVANLP